MSDISAITYQGSAATTPSNTTADPAGPFAAFVVTATGTVSIVMVDGSTLAFGSASFTAGPTTYPFQFKRVNTTGTTATVVGLYALPLKAPLNPGAGPGGAP
jgi:hypothetical protein